MRARTLWIAGVVLAVVATAGVIALVRHGAPGDSTAGDPIQTGLDPLGGIATAPSVTDTPTIDFSVTTKAATKGRAGLASAEKTAWDRYLAETKTVVVTNAPELRVLVDSVLAALLTDDTSRLASSWAPDEGVNTGYIEDLARAYPRVERGAFQPTVNVFAVARATVYFAYAQVEWTDGGIVSSHTITIPVRFIGGRWYLSSIGLNTKGLTSVQAVPVPQ